ncbi:uncharacterized protein HD556DRAFT_1304889 [Suillus plorans]|uniref:Uncharacterized protein n=1 Tax=Suillus plorans TaxID=116603 RepID=A0A9P7J3N4_9AGAM|nr:uncharacterized protein HD556DRAFT_1304889 [Suillus plorans]KAG1800907.1 hypothetical protein HD556DRAFT_1304889 [Suillus plorans]
MSRPSKVAKLGIERFNHQISAPAAVPLQRLREYVLSSDGHTSLHTEYIPIQSQPTCNETDPVDTTPDFLHKLDGWNEVPPDAGETEYELPHEKRKQTAADTPILVWIPEHQAFLDELLRLEGQGVESQ